MKERSTCNPGYRVYGSVSRRNHDEALDSSDKASTFEAKPRILQLERKLEARRNHIAAQEVSSDTQPEREKKSAPNGTKTRSRLLISLVVGFLLILGAILGSLFAVEKIGKGK